MILYFGKFWNLHVGHGCKSLRVVNIWASHKKYITLHFFFLLTCYLSIILFHNVKSLYKSIVVARRMKGFKLYISNTSIIASGYLCYEDTAQRLPKITQNIACNQLGKYVVYFDNVPGPGDNGSIIELCYVSINGK